MDEFHFYADPDRGWAWQVPLLELPQAQFVLMSATLGDVSRFERRPDPAHRPADRRRRAPPTGRCRWTTSYALTPLHETIEELLDHRPGARSTSCTSPRPRRSSGRQALMSINVCTREEKDAIAELIGDFRFTAGFGKTLSRLVRHGIGVHHAGMLPEVPPAGRAARPGRPAQGHLRHRHPRRRHQRADPHGAVHRAVQVRRHAGRGMLTAREFHQIAGRAGRAGFDTAGTVVVQAPEHVDREREGAGQGGRRPEEAAQGASARSRRRASCRWGEADLRPAGRPPSPSR